MLASPHYSGRQSHSVAKTNGFTLVELLTVVAVIMILAGIVVGVQRGVYSSQANAKARAELHTIATALEQYKATYGTYPRIQMSGNSDEANAQELFNHLTGAKWHTGSGSETDTGARAPFIDAMQMTTKKTSNNPVAFIDPWGMYYVYNYNQSTLGDHFYILLSTGSDKAGGSVTPAHFVSSDAYFTDAATNRADDIVFGLENN